MRGSRSIVGDLRILLQLLRGQQRQGSHAERLQAFYAPQAEHYDVFRARLLHGREELIARLDIPAGAHVVELGCGTGSSLSIVGDDIDRMVRFDMVDLCPALLDVARQRAAGHAHVQVHEADAALWQPERPVDRVLISYALTMIPEWRRVIDNAHAMLVPGGKIGIVDFHLPAAGRLNGFWRRWFAHDGVHLSGEHLAALRSVFSMHWAEERFSRMPYMPLLQAPYYLFVGTRPHYEVLSAGSCCGA